MNYLRQSTAVDIALGPFVDATDGVTAETALTISQADVRLKKNNGAWAQVNDATSATHEENGWYEKELDATDTDTVGILIVAVNESGALPVWREFQVLEEAVYDQLIAASALGYIANAPVNVAQISGDGTAADNLEAVLDGTGGVTLVASAITLTTPITANATQLSGDATAADNAEAFFDGTGYAGTNNVIPTVTTLTNLPTIPANWLTAAGTAADFTTEIQAGLATAANLATVDTVVDGIKAVTDLLPDAGALTSLATAANLATVDTVVDGIKAKTDSLTFTTAGMVDSAIKRVGDTTLTAAGTGGQGYGAA
jgi:hypothetical protein